MSAPTLSAATTTATTVEPDDLDERLARRAASVDRFTASVTHLLDERSDLQGVTPMADLIYDAVRWSA